MAAISAQLAKSFLQASSCRRACRYRPLSGLSFPSRRWKSAAASPLPEAHADLVEPVEAAKTNETVQESSAHSESKKDVVGLDVSTAGPKGKSPAKRKLVLDKLADGAEVAKRKLPPKKAGTRQPSVRKNSIDPTTLHTSKQELPPPDQWTYFFPYMKETQHRTTLRNPETARMIAETLVPKGSKDKIIIEAYPGAGMLSRALLALPKERIKKLIVIEDAISFVPFIKPLAEMDPRVTVIQKEGKQWNSYAEMEEDGSLDGVKTLPWEQVHDQLHFIMQTPIDTHGEQFVAQLLRTVPDRQWLFKYGRVPMSFILTERMWERVKAIPDTHIRCKVSAMAQAIAILEEVVHPKLLQPYSDHFHPQRLGPVQVSESVITITPYEEQIIPSGDLDIWDYCLRKLFVMRATPLEKCIGGLGPGAKNILPKFTDPSLPEDKRVDPSRTPRQLDIREWALVVNAFKNWPFRPTDLSIESFSASRR